MPVNVVDHPAEPQCGGHQWFVDDTDALAMLTAIVMVGRARQVGHILDGAEQGTVIVATEIKARLKRELVLEAGVEPWHRDGLLFETICWIVARKGANADETLSDPHRRATQQGADTVKVAFDPHQRELLKILSMNKSARTVLARNSVRRSCRPSRAGSPGCETTS